MNKTENEKNGLKVALVCDFLTKMGGAQKTLAAICELYPDAPIYCMIYDEEGTHGIFKNHKIITTSLQKYQIFFRQKPKYLIGKYSRAVEEHDLSKYDVVISSNDSYAHGVITKPETFHLCYCHTPTRYLWDWTNEYLHENNIGWGLKGLYIRNILHKYRLWDRASADRVDHFLANSENVRKRISKYYRQDSRVLYPPVEVSEIEMAKDGPSDYFLIVSRLEPYKRIDLVIDVCNKLQKKLIIVGEGSSQADLEAISGPTIKFVGWQSDVKTYQFYRDCRAFIFAGEDDFGITPLEAMAAGRPVIAYSRGGALETVVQNVTGVFFDNPTTESLEKAIVELEEKYDTFIPQNCRSQAEKFSKEKFLEHLSHHVDDGYRKYLEKMKNA
ncbi:glycosyltransferase family 4 protein [Candidatus Berkelbacteria bacterium CG10_big_fil_rev_8_21_14_0_10_43_13]|uniref:Glycosyltransferase family 4 protein n=1 Tax=Candidatus Berkelbacteria bacterium CG10_big_fil_rev_8_21_14_0_10_43_13 TaxID=1974514 RepID=A0A2H0W8E4_9BACT|nr:MAG: glycosyltransferase family 4 protein [Candidatus Berkelbacteria bacterium CG10_big_fil_rev_8_21_14_0_10_43_13]